jgi:hypothetical protein
MTQTYFKVNLAVQYCQAFKKLLCQYWPRINCISDWQIYSRYQMKRTGSWECKHACMLSQGLHYRVKHLCTDRSTKSILFQKWVFSKCKLPDVGNCMKDDSSDHSTHAFPVVWCPGSIFVTTFFLHLGFSFSNAKFSNYSPNVDVGFVTYIGQFLWKQGFQD